MENWRVDLFCNSVNSNRFQSSQIGVFVWPKNIQGTQYTILQQVIHFSRIFPPNYLGSCRIFSNGGNDCANILASNFGTIENRIQILLNNIRLIGRRQRSQP